MKKKSINFEKKLHSIFIYRYRRCVKIPFYSDISNDKNSGRYHPRKFFRLKFQIALPTA